MWLHVQAATARQTVVFKMSQGSRLFRPKKEPLDKDRRKKNLTELAYMSHGVPHCQITYLEKSHVTLKLVSTVFSQSTTDMHRKARFE